MSSGSRTLVAVHTAVGEECPSESSDEKQEKVHLRPYSPCEPCVRVLDTFREVLFVERSVGVVLL